jgi:hypothetical protein
VEIAAKFGNSGLRACFIQEADAAAEHELRSRLREGQGVISSISVNANSKFAAVAGHEWLIVSEAPNGAPARQRVRGVAGEADDGGLARLVRGHLSHIGDPGA